MNYKLIILDFDGTIADTRHIILTTMQATISEMGLPMASDEQCAATIGLPLVECFKRIYPGVSDEIAKQCASTYCHIFDINKHRLTPSLFPGMSDTLSTLSKQGITLAVASSRSHDSLVELLEMLDIRHLFSLVMGCDNVELTKPHPQAVLNIMRQLGFTPQETLVVGDMPVDIEMGQRAGASTCAVTWGNSSLDQLKLYSPTFIIDSVNQLPSKLT